MADDEDGQQLYWDDDSKRYYKYDAEKDDYFTDDETRAADEAAAQEAAEEAGKSSADTPPDETAKESPPSPPASPSVAPSSSPSLTSADRAGSSRDVKPSSPVVAAPSETGGPSSGDTSKESGSPTRQGSKTDPAPATTTTSTTPAVKEAVVPETRNSSEATISQETPSPKAPEKLDTSSSTASPAVEVSGRASSPSAPDSPVHTGQAFGPGRQSTSGGARRNADLAVGADLLPRASSRFGGGSSLLGDGKPDGDFSLSSRRGSGMSSGLAEAAVAFHELEAKKKEVQELQEKLAKTEKNVEELSVRLIQAERGMTDDERVANLTRERDELLIQVKRLEDDLAGFEECLEAAAVEKESALVQAEKNKELSSDLKLQYDNLLIDKDLEIATLREELAQKQVELQNSQQLRPEIAQLRERILHYDKTFVQLKQLLLKVSAEKNAIEEENQALMEYRSNAEEKIAELEGGASEDAQLLQTYESQHGAQRDLIEAQERQLGILVRQLQESNAAKVTYQQAFDRLSKVFKEKEAKNRAAMEQLNVENNQLRSKNEHLQSLTAPRWQRVYTLKQQSKTPLKKVAVKSTPPRKSGSSAFSSSSGGGGTRSSPSSSDSAEGKASAQESSSGQGVEASEAHEEGGADSTSGRLIERGGQEGSHEKIIAEGGVEAADEGVMGGTQGEEMLEALQIQIATLQAHAIQRQIQISCRDEKLRLLRLALPDDCVAKIVKTSEGVVAMHAAVWQCFLYLQHVYGLYVQPLLADATSNPKTTTKEQGFILWLFNSIRSVAFLARALSLFLYYLRSSSSSTSSSSILSLLESPDGAAYTVAISALRHTSKIVSSATACTLSSSFPLEPFDDAVHAISLLLPPSLAQAITGVPPQQPGSSSSSPSSSPSSWNPETDSRGSKVGLEKAGSKQSRGSASDRGTSPSKAGSPGRKPSQGGEKRSGRSTSSSTSSPATGQGEREDSKGHESIDALMSLAPCVVSTLHVMRAIGLLAVAGSCAFEVDKSGEKGAAVAGVIAAQDARTKWMDFMTTCSKALHALPSWLPPIVEGQEGILEKRSDKSEGEKNDKTKGFFPLLRDRSSRGGSGDASQKGGTGNLSTPTVSATTFGAWIGRKVKIEKERSPEEDNDAGDEEDEGEEGVGDNDSGNKEKKDKKNKKQQGQETTSVFPTFEETFLATRRLLAQLVEAPELKDSKFIPDRGFQILHTFVCAFDTEKRTIASFTLSPVVGGWCSVWDTIPSSIHSWLKEEEKMDKKVEQLIEEEKKLQAQIEEQRETIAEKERLASKWEHLYSSARPKAEKYDRLEEELQTVLKEKSNCVHMLDAARRKVDQQNHEAHQLRHDKREIGVRLQELTKRLEALKKVSLSHAGGGGDVEQIQMLRQIIRKQEAELLEVRLAGALKDAVPSKHEQEAVDVLRELGRGSTAESLTSAGSFSRAPSFMQDLRRDGTDGGPLAWQRSLARQPSSSGGGRMPTGVIHSSSLQQRVLMHQQTLKMQIEEAEADAQDISGPEAGLQMLEEYRRLQNAVLLHSFQVPIWNPSVAPEENRAKLRRYRNEHDALQLQMLSLTKKIDRFFTRVAEGSRGGFGEHASLSTSRYIRQFTMLADVASPASSLQSSSPCLDQASSSSTATGGVVGDSSGAIRPSGGVKDEKEATGKEGETPSLKTESVQPHPVTDLAVRDGFNTPAGMALRTPVMRLTVAGKPAWMSGGTGGKAAYTAGAATPVGEASGKTGERSDGQKGEGRGKHETMSEKGVGRENAGKGVAAHGRCPEVVQKRLIVTEAQLAALYKKIAGL